MSVNKNQFDENLKRIIEDFKKYKKMSEQGSAQDLLISQPSVDATDAQVNDPKWMKSQGFMPVQDMETSIKSADEQNTALAAAAQAGSPVYQYQGKTYAVANPMYGKGGTSQPPKPLTPQQVQQMSGTNIRTASGAPVVAGHKMVKETSADESVPNYRKLINLVEAVNSGCPIATHNIDVNLKNRQKAIDEYHYGPANPNEPGDYWKKAAVRWKVSEKIVKTMKCENCGAFDVSDDMRKCIEDGIRGDDKKIADARAPIDLADLGYCTFLKFKCAGTRTCSAWITGGPIVKD